MCLFALRFLIAICIIYIVKLVKKCLFYQNQQDIFNILKKIQD